MITHQGAEIQYWNFFLVALCICCCMWAFSSSRDQGAVLCCGKWTFHWGGFCFGVQALSAQALAAVAHSLSSCGSKALESRFNSCGPWAYLLLRMWNLPRSGIKPMSPALAGGFLYKHHQGSPILKLLFKWVLKTSPFLYFCVCLYFIYWYCIKKF